MPLPTTTCTLCTKNDNTKGQYNGQLIHCIAEKQQQNDKRLACHQQSGALLICKHVRPKDWGHEDPLIMDLKVLNDPELWWLCFTFSCCDRNAICANANSQLCCCKHIIHVASHTKMLFTADDFNLTTSFFNSFFTL